MHTPSIFHGKLADEVILLLYYTFENETRPTQSIFSLAFGFFFTFLIFSSKLLTLCTGNRCPKIYSICRSKFRPLAVLYTLAISKFMVFGIIQDGIHNNSATNFYKIISFWPFNILILCFCRINPCTGQIKSKFTRWYPKPERSGPL